MQAEAENAGASVRRPASTPRQGVSAGAGLKQIDDEIAYLQAALARAKQRWAHLPSSASQAALRATSPSGAATASNGHVVFAPSRAENVGVFDPTDTASSPYGTLSTVDISASYFSAWRDPFRGAAATADGLVVFAPYDAPFVGLFNATSRTFSTVDISAAISTSKLYNGAAATHNH